MSTIFDSRKYLVIFTAITLSLIMWLSVSFWTHAYIQRTDAQQIQASSAIEDGLFALAHSLSAERALMYQLVSAKSVNTETLDRFRAATQQSDHLLNASFNTIDQMESPSDHDSYHSHGSHEMEAVVTGIDEKYQNLKAQRAFTLERISLPWDEQRSKIGMNHFHKYSNLIHSIGSLRKDIHFVPRITNQEVFFHYSLKDSVWDLSEATAQITSLLEGVLLLNESSDARISTAHHADMLAEQNLLAEASWNEIMQVTRRHHLNSTLEEHKDLTAIWYKNEYGKLNRELMDSLMQSEVRPDDIAKWLSTAAELHDRVETLRNDATVFMLSAVRQVEKKATTNLIIDTALVLLCLGMAIVALLYFKRVHRQAHQDELTGLSNRRRFSIDIRQALDSARAADDQMALLIIDLDRFKHINDSMGHAVGDRLLQSVASRLKEVCAESDYVARLGGDEFSVLKECTSAVEVAALAETIRQNLANPFYIDGGILQIGGSIGTSLYPVDALTSEDLMKSADLAMYCAKKQGRNKIVQYDTELALEYEYRVSTEADLQTALREKQFELYFQPKFNLTHQMVDSVEALLRWHHPERGLVPPDKFIPIAEECGLLPAIGGWVLDEACRQAASWLQEQKLPLRIAVNVSAEQFLQPGFVLGVLRCLKRHNLPPQYLELEVTESVVMADIEIVAGSLKVLQQAGIKIALDDFGTGYSSLSYLQDLPLDTLKIDKSFIQKLVTGNAQHESITETITELASTLGLDTVAEGVETDDQLSHVANMGISSVQGYFYSKPVCADDVWQVVSGINDSSDDQRDAA
ncbi:MAG: bifunctional diguanylate cyclase/phosphodiesterase [Gammaproteobacteria bacterium]|nr:bifunctional diguanylate cyclase/phosphodiesterase [Gammaproteobacteria bacterium]